MAFAISTVKYSGAINEVVLGSANKLTVGGETCYPFFTFEGKMPNKPKIAMEIWDMDPGEDWPEAARARVSVPAPAPISRTTSSGQIPVRSTIIRAVDGSFKKFWPYCFLGRKSWDASRVEGDFMGFPK